MSLGNQIPRPLLLMLLVKIGQLKVFMPSPLSFCPPDKSFTKDSGGHDRGNSCGTLLDNPAMVSCSDANVGGPTTDVAKNAKTVIRTSQFDQSTPTTSKAQTTTGLSLIWQSLQSQGISKPAAHIILKSWQSGTLQQYQTYLNKWMLFCSERQVNTISPSLKEFLISL